MKAIITIFRHLFSFIILLIISLILIFSPILISLSNSITNRGSILSWLDESGIYKEGSNIAYKLVLDSISKEGISLKEIPIKNLDKIIKSAVSESFIKTSSTSIINGIYDWLERKTPNLTISTIDIDLTKQIKDALPKEVYNQLDIVKQLNLLKPCTQAQAKKYEKLGGFTNVNDICLPPTLNIVDVIDQQYSNIIDTKVVKVENIFNIPTIDTNQYKDILFYFDLARYSQYILIGIIVILSILYLLVDPSKNFKYITLAITFIISGGINYYLFKSNFITDSINNVLDKTLFIQKDLIIKPSIITNIVSLVTTDIFKNTYSYSLYILLGGISILLLYLIVKYVFKAKK